MHLLYEHIVFHIILVICHEVVNPKGNKNEHQCDSLYVFLFLCLDLVSSHVFRTVSFVLHSDVVLPSIVSQESWWHLARVLARNENL